MPLLRYTSETETEESLYEVSERIMNKYHCYTSPTHTFSDWRRMCLLSLVMSLPRENKTH